MSQFSADTDAVTHNETGDGQPTLHIPPQDAAIVMSALNRIQILAETLSETTLDAMQVELVGALIDTGMDLRRTLLGVAAADPAPAEEDVIFLEDEFDLGSVGLHEEDFRDFQESLFLYEETLPYSPPREPFAISDESMLDVVDAEKSEPGAATLPEVHGPLSGLRVMLVDENPFQVVAVTNLLRELGADAAAVSAEFAAHSLKTGRFDAALVDMQSAARIGLSLVRVLRVASNAREERAAIFSILAHATPEQIRDCLAAGADGWLPRPPTRTNLLEQLEVLAIEKSFDQEAA